MGQLNSVRKYLQIAMIAWITLVSCSVLKKPSGLQSDEGNSTGLPRIIFLNYEIKKDLSNESFSISLLDMIISSGNLKEGLADHKKPSVNDLVLTVRDRENQVLHQEFVANPLVREVEFVDGAGLLNMKTIQSDSAQFTIRLQLGNGASTIDLEHFMGEDSDSIHLLTHAIQ